MTGVPPVVIFPQQGPMGLGFPGVPGPGLLPSRAAGRLGGWARPCGAAAAAVAAIPAPPPIVGGNGFAHR
jgi:hypothetical protein